MLEDTSWSFSYAKVLTKFIPTVFELGIEFTMAGVPSTDEVNSS
jgi:hypothetical protein